MACFLRFPWLSVGIIDSVFEFYRPINVRFERGCFFSLSLVGDRLIDIGDSTAFVQLFDACQRERLLMVHRYVLQHITIKSARNFSVDPFIFKEFLVFLSYFIVLCFGNLGVKLRRMHSCTPITMI